MKKWLFIVWFTLVLAGCEEDYYPPGLYANQVEWLLTGGSEKTWVLTNLEIEGNNVPLNDCWDSVRVSFQAKLASDNSIQSIAAYQLTYRQDCQTFDTTFYGNMYASASPNSPNKNVFSDSLVFEEGGLDYVLVEAISSEAVTWRQLRSGQVRRSAFLAR